MDSIVRALVLYALAEFQCGHATTIRVTVQGSSFSVADDGRGHAIERSIEGVPYLEFIYNHMEYPFAPGQNAPIQLQGIGMSLITKLCSELEVTVTKRDATLRLLFRDGRACERDLKKVNSEQTGNAISGAVDLHRQAAGVDGPQLEHWLLAVADANPALKLFFNGCEMRRAGPLLREQS